MAHHVTSKKRQWIVTLQTGASLEYYAESEMNVHISSAAFGLWCRVDWRIVNAVSEGLSTSSVVADRFIPTNW
jgi:hypothetical protein